MSDNLLKLYCSLLSNDCPQNQLRIVAIFNAVLQAHQDVTVQIHDGLSN